MRWQMRVVIAVLVGFVALDLALGQVQMQMGNFGGLGGKDGKSDPLALLRNASVKRELRITEDQAGKVDDAVWAALGKVLDAEQVKRLKQIELQQRDFMAFSDPAVQSSLKMSKDQKESIKTILTDAEKEMASLADAFKGFIGGNPGKGGGNVMNMGERFLAIRKETKERCTEVLTGEQKRIWEEMVGDDFKMEQPKFDFKKKKGG